MTEESWDVIRLASAWREGVLPEAGGLQDQSAWVTAAVQIVLGAWGKLDAARIKKLRKD